MNNRHADNTAFASLRLQLGMTQQEFADSLGVSRSLVGMAETGKRSFPVAARSLLVDLHNLSGQMPIAETVPAKEKRRSSASAARIYNRVDKLAWQRSLLKSSLGKDIGTGQGDKSTLPHPNAATGTAMENQSGIQAISCRAECIAIMQVQSVQKQVLEQQLHYKIREREAAGVKGQELAGLLTYINAMVSIEDTRMNSLAVPLSQKNAAIRKAKFQHKKLLLERQLLRFNGPSLLMRELKINMAERQIRELGELLEALQQRLDELP